MVLFPLTTSSQYSPPRSSPYGARNALFIHGPGQQVQLAPLSGPGSNSHSGLIDPCNLFCKVILMLAIYAPSTHLFI